MNKTQLCPWDSPGTALALAQTHLSLTIQLTSHKRSAMDVAGEEEQMPAQGDLVVDIWKGPKK